MNNRLQNFTIPAMTYGMYTALAIILVIYGFGLTGNFFAGGREILMEVILIFAIVKGCKGLREYQGGYLTYGRSFAFGVSIAFYASILVGFSLYILFKFIKPEIFIELKNLQIEMLEQVFGGAEADDAAIEMYDQLIKETNKNLTPFTTWLGMIFSLTLYGAFFSLIISIFTKKKNPNPFAEIEEDDNSISSSK